MSAQEFTEAQARKALAATGLNLGRANLVRMGSVAGFALPDKGWLARVSPADQGQRLGFHEVSIAQAMETAAVPAARLAPVENQPLITPEGVVTLWEFIDHTPVADPSPSEMGKLCRSLHEATKGGAPAVGPLDPLGIIEELIKNADQRALVTARDLTMLWKRHAELLAAWPIMAANDPLGSALCHGDLHSSNALIGRFGVVLIDLETAGNGMRSYDHTAVLVHHLLYGKHQRTYNSFADAYGFDIRTWDAHRTLCDVYAMWTTAWAVVYRERSADVDREAEVRLNYWRGKRPLEAWTLR